MPARTSTRQAAVKANQAFGQGAGTKRKGPESGHLPPKKGKKDLKPDEGNNYEKPSVTEETQEIKSSEDPSQAQTTVNKQPTEAPPKRAEEPEQKDAVVEEKKPENVANGMENNPTGDEKEEPDPKQSKAAIKISPEREAVLPSSILEKGIIYFFFRPRVNVDEPHSIDDVARSFFVLRPTPKGAEIKGGPIGDDDHCRLMMLPKKRYPSSGKERDMGFVEKAKVTLKTLRETLMTTKSYETKTRGERTTPEAQPYAEGVYALIKEGSSSHLAYILTIPRELGDIQSDFGLYDRGSFVIQSKSPKYPGPATARLPQEPEYPESVLEKFQHYRWIPTEPELLDYPNAQFLMIGSAQSQLGRAGGAHVDDKGTKKDPAEELGQLEEENEERVETLAGDHSIFDDLGVDVKRHESLPSAWE
ncbi:hypothetical protein UA08_07991 [Talaromyces atroroseus]|uniref:BTB domain transcription factor n=1 Tax=Talaromyces atroroseus TaxID=1441469 RepID=A0A225AHX4_TALAT|nr:hypothetical protein UA08_07991 [Talaromyces atroroseus]OKL56688.1 hypothetical protein UA08_07991 [Talaromyces atroroseus]